MLVGVKLVICLPFFNRTFDLVSKTPSSFYSCRVARLTLSELVETIWNKVGAQKKEKKAFIKVRTWHMIRELQKIIITQIAKKKKEKEKKKTERRRKRRTRSNSKGRK